MHPIIPILNLIASAASATGGIIGLANPGFLSGSTQLTKGEIFYARMYAARAIPLALLSGLLPLWYKGTFVAGTVVTAGVIQVADIFIAICQRDNRMIPAASIAAIIHIKCAAALLST